MLGRGPGSSNNPIKAINHEASFHLLGPRAGHRFVGG
jgi:hypothetical protein